jgi:glycosyltransferase involved in cell wall biosynthesis
MEPMRITFLLDDTALCGGVKVVLRQADLLADRGHRVTVVSPGPKPEWHASRAAFSRLSGLSSPLPEADVTVATYWTTIEAATSAPSGEVAHYCQGFEASFSHNRHEHPAILSAYARPLPALVVAPHLAELLASRFGRPARVVPQPLERLFTPRQATAASPRPRILVMGPFEIDWKGVATALEAVRQLRDRGFACQLIRISQWPQPEEERNLMIADQAYVGLSPPEVAEVMRSCDLLLAPSWSQEGFGLPVLEAMASGVPVVASDVPCYRDFAAGAARLVPCRDASAFAAAGREILGDAEEWRWRRQQGLSVAQAYAEPRVALAVEEAMAWVASGTWRSSRDGGPG